MRVLTITLDPSEGQGGIEGRAMAYTAGLVNRGIHVEVAALSPGKKTSEEAYQGTKLVRLSSSFLRFPWTLRSLVHLMGRSSVDSVFMLSGGATGAGIVVLCVSRLTGRRSAVMFYGRDILQSRRRPIGRIALLMSVLLADGVGANSRYTLSLLPFRPRTPVIVYPGVDVGRARQRETAGRSRSEPRILFVGRLVRRKGADILLAAFGQLRAELPSVRLDVVGDGPEMSNLVSQANRLGLEGAVTFHGALFGQRLWDVYAKASLLVLPSRQSASDAEGFGTVFLEAGVFGIPSVGTRTGGIPEAVIDGATGKLVRADSTDELRSAIKSLRDDPEEMERMGLRALEWARRFSWERSTDQVLRLLGYGPGESTGLAVSTENRRTSPVSEAGMPGEGL